MLRLVPPFGWLFNAVNEGGLFHLTRPLKVVDICDILYIFSIVAVRGQPHQGLFVDSFSVPPPSLMPPVVSDGEL